MNKEQVITRHPRDFTVQLRHTTTNALKGTGIVVSEEKIVTCAHVVVAAGVNPRLGRRIPRSWEMVLQSLFGQKAEPLMEVRDAEVGVYFPEGRGRKSEERRARVVAWFPEYEDDVVVLQLVGGPAPVRPEQIARLGTAESSEGNPFRSYGYSPTGANPATRAEGTIMGTVERAPESQLQADLLQLKSDEIDAGMSGAGVLDTTRNLVVGLIAECYDPGKSQAKKELGYAVDSYVLTFDPFSLPVQSEDIPLEEVPPPRTDIEAARAAVAAAPGNVLHGAPAPLTEWVGRQDLLQALNDDWADPACHVSELIGFGGEGKSSLARRWLDQLLRDPSLPQPDGVFWWNCYDNRSEDALFEAALEYLSGGSIDPRAYPSTFARAHFIAGMLTKGRFLFILDGLEVLQHQQGDDYGSLINPDLSELLSHLADPRHDSFCVLTSRAPVIDLFNYTSFHHHDVERLSPKDGRDLLRKLGVTGSDAALDKVAKDWDGHALTLSLLGGYLVEQYGGDIAHIADLPIPIANEPRYERVQRVLRRYDEHLSEAERNFLMLFSAFRLPVAESALTSMFRARKQGLLSRLLPRRRARATGPTNVFNAPIAALDDAAFDALLKRLVAYRILSYNPQARHYTTHPIIRAYYFDRFNERDRAQVQAAHGRIKDYYLSIAGYYTPSNPTLGDLVPLIEAVHHGCCAGAYEKALDIFWERLDQGPRDTLLQQLGAFETGLALLLDFFPNGDTSQEPQVSHSGDKTRIISRVGYCLLKMGRDSEALHFYERAIPRDLNSENWLGAVELYLNITDIYERLGFLTTSADAAREALTLARRKRAKEQARSIEKVLRPYREFLEVSSLTYQAWIAHLLGDLKTAGETFLQAEALGQENDPTKRYLYSQRGIRHADYLRRIGEADYARRITKENLEEWTVLSKWLDDESRCHRVLGDLDADAGERESARQHFDEALRIARSSARFVLIEALLARGRFAARQGEAEAARGYLAEALGYAVTGGYRLYEVDIAIAQAWAYCAMGDVATARAQAERAQRLSKEMGYYWGQVDAKEVLAAIEG